MIIDGGEELGADPFFWTPSQVRSELTTARELLDSVNADISRAAGRGRITNAEWKQWRAFYVAKHRFTQSASGYWGGNVEIARKIRRDAIKWRELVKAKGGRVSGPRPTDPEDEPGPDKLAGWVKWAVVAVVAVAAAPAIKSAALMVRRRRS